ncbi:C40 family peptidase [Enterobacteriaceae bacterium ESL0689]|nr:C40 family peptidase [Enterobacteriaceae bacterium ESL0689]
MAQLYKITISFCVLLFSALSVTPLALASGQTPPAASSKSPQTKNISDRKTRLNSKQAKAPRAQVAKTSVNKTSAALSKERQTKRTSEQKSQARQSTKPLAARQTAKITNQCPQRKGDKKQCAKSAKASAKPMPVAMNNARKKCASRKGQNTNCKTTREKSPLTLSAAHKARVQKAQTIAMSKLMGQIGKPYRWGGTSPQTGFDCSGLIYYAYKDLVKIRIPRTANEMYHLDDARPVERSELQSGDLVFFRTQNRGVADHVGVYVGNGKFIQSPRSGRDIQITSLSEDYWTRHYVGARRVMTPKNLR